MGLADQRALAEEDSKAVASSKVKVKVTRAVGEAAGAEGEGGDVIKSALLTSLFGAFMFEGL